MALGRRGGKQDSLWVSGRELPRSAGHPFYRVLEGVLSEAGFDRFVEERCVPYYAERKGRPSIPPGVYFRMLFVGYFEGIDSQRGIAWRCQDSLSIREFLGLGVTERSPEHSSMTVIRKRLPFEVFEEVFRFVLRCAHDRGLLKGKTVAVDATFLEASAAMKSIVRRDSGEGWSAYIKKLAEAEGIENPSDEDARRLDRKRPKQVSNDEWGSPSDPESRIVKMKDGRTHLAYKAEHAVDLETDLVVSASIYRADHADCDSLASTLDDAQDHLAAVDPELAVEEVVADKGYHAVQALAECAARGIRTYIPERRQAGRRRWKAKPKAHREAFQRNRRRVRRVRSRLLQKRRSELVERSFAHTCRTGQGRRAYFRGVYDVGKRWLGQLAGRNLGVIVRALIGVGSPRSLQREGEWQTALSVLGSHLARSLARLGAWIRQHAPIAKAGTLHLRAPTVAIARVVFCPISTGC
jgi:transposase